MKVLLRISKYALIMFLVFFVVIVVAFLIINYNLKYEIPVITKMELYDKDGKKYLSYSNNKKQTYVNLEEISPHLIDAIISIEDKRFYGHRGIDVIRMFGALLSDIKAGKIVEGASTITQQYVKLLFLNNEQTIKRKIHEALIAFNLESKYSKEQILEGYLNIIYFDHGVYGVEDASIFYFGKKACELTLIEACSLASIPKGPSIYSPINNPDNNRSRRNLILGELYRDGIIDAVTYEENLDKELNITGFNPDTQDINAPYFQDQVINEVKKMGLLNEYLYQGVKVYTTLDSNLNQKAIDSLAMRLPDSDIEASIIVIDPKSGHILTLIGGKDYDQSSYNRAVNSLRQPGSSIKPFLYLAALENGFTTATTFVSEPTVFYYDNQSYAPKNYKEIYAEQDISMVYAIATSDNIYAMKTHLFLGTDVLSAILKRFRFSGSIPSIPSLALGTHETTLKEITSAYATLANLGDYIKPTLITKIETYDGKTIYEQTQPTKETIADPTDVYLLNEAMTSVFDNKMMLNTRPTGARLTASLTNTYSGKSGSTDTDNWMLGYNQDIVVGVWSGYDDARDIVHATDTSFGKYVWRDIIESYLEGKKTSWYERPETTVRIDLNPITGFYAGVDEYYKAMYFKKTNIPWYIELLYHDNPFL